MASTYAVGARRALLNPGNGIISVWLFLFAFLCISFRPGFSIYDTIYQYREVLSRHLTDWHPPIMAVVWTALSSVEAGTDLMFILQMSLFGVGFALFVAALARSGRPKAAIAAGVTAISPLFFCWQTVIVKDSQMLGALVAAVGLNGWFRLRQRPTPKWASIVSCLLLLYATLLRANGVFATAPIFLLLVRGVPDSRAVRAMLLLAIIALTLALQGPFNHWALGADVTDRPKSEALFDLAGIATQVSDPYPFTVDERAAIVSNHCYKPFFWDPLEINHVCRSAVQRVRALPTTTLYFALAQSVLVHPIAYAEHRLKHWNTTERLWVPTNLIGADPPFRTLPNDVHLDGPRLTPIATEWIECAGQLSRTFIGWPICWTILAALLLPLAMSAKDAASQIAVSLLSSALVLEISFIALSIASELRYHLWPMLATALATILISERLEARRVVVIGTILLAASGIGTLARETLPVAPGTYDATLRGYL